jgi:serine/threonine protein kinase
MKLCLRCNQYFEDVVEQCPADNSALEAVGDNPLIGALINDRYVVDTVIGKGSSGIVYKATRLLMQREVAVKVLHSYLGAESGSLDRFLREARAASQLKHPHIINIWESGVTDDGQPYFVMDYLEGSTLAELVKDKGALPLQRTLPIVRQICEALGEAHRQSIVHRDVKPENIVLQESDYANQEDFVKVLDFGIADQAAAGDQPGSPRQRTAAGSPAYMSPEQCQGFPLDLRSDIYSLAIVVYELLTGARPFEAEDIMTLFRMHVKSPPPSLSQIRPDLKFPVKLEMAINKALSKDPAQRQQDVMAFCKDVEVAVEGFLLETLENEYNTPGSERSGKAISTLVLGAAEDEDVAPVTEKLHDIPQDEDAIKFGNSWNMPSTGKVDHSFGNNGGTVPLSVPGIAEPFTSSPSGFSIPSKPQSPSAKQADAHGYNIGDAFEENGGLLNPGQSDTENFKTSSSPSARDAESESASRLLQSAKRASQSFKTNLSNAGGEDVSDWARQILQRKTSPNVPPAAAGGGNGAGTASSASGASVNEDNLAISAISSVDLQAPDSQEALPPPKITPVPALSQTASQQDVEDSPHVSAWAQQILKRKPDDTSLTGAGPARSSSALQRIASTGTSDIISKQSSEGSEETVISEMTTVDVEEVPAQNLEELTEAEAPSISPQSPQPKGDLKDSKKSPTRTLLEGDLTFDESLTAPEIDIEEVPPPPPAPEIEEPIIDKAPAILAQSPQPKGDLKDAKKSPTRTLLEGDLTFDDSLTAPDKGAGNGVQSSDRDLASLRPELSRPGSTHSKMSIQDAIDAQRKETGKFNSKDIEAWGAMIEAKKAGDAAAQQKNADNVNVLHKLASTSNAAAKTSPVAGSAGTSEAVASASASAASAPIAPTTDSGATNAGGKSDSPLTAGGRRRFEDPVNAKVESSSKFAKEVDKILDAAIFKTGEHNAHPESASGNKSGRVDATPNFDASRFEQPINKKNEKLNPFAKEIDKVIDSAIAKGGPKRTGDETGLMSSIGRDAALDPGGAAAKPTIRKEGRSSGSSGGPDLKKLLSRRKADGSSPNILDRAQQAAKGDQEPDALTAHAHDHEHDVPSADSLPLAGAEHSGDSSYAGANEPTPDMVAAAENTLAAFSTQAQSIADEPAKAYSRSELDAISFGKTPATPEPAPEVPELPEAIEAPVKMKLDKMRAMNPPPKQSQPGFGDKLKSIFGTKSGMSPIEKEDKKDKNKGTKAGMAAVTKDKEKKDSSSKSGMPAAEMDKGTKSGMTPAGRESSTGLAPAASGKGARGGMIAPTPDKSTKSGLAAIGAFFGGGKKQATHQTMPAASVASLQPKIEQPSTFIPAAAADPAALAATSAAINAAINAGVGAAAQIQPSAPDLDEDDDEPVFTSLSNADLTSKIDMADYSAAPPMPEGVRAEFTPPAFTPPKPIDHYQNQPTSFVFGNKAAEAESTASAKSEAPAASKSEPPATAHRSPGIAEALAALKSTEEEEAPSTAEGAESATTDEPNAFERAVAEALAAEEARAQEQAAVAAERADREAAAAARAMAEIEAGKEAEARAKAEAAAEEARQQAEREAAEVRFRTAAEASERARFEEQEKIDRAEREARERAEREGAERAEAERIAQEADLARAAAEARARAEREAAEQAAVAAAAAAAAATAATAAMMKLKEEEEEKRQREEQLAAREAAAQEAAAKEAAAREFAAREAAAKEAYAREAAAEAAERQAAEMAGAERGGPEIVDTPSKLSGKASNSQLAQMLNRFSKKGASSSPDGAGVAPAAYSQPQEEMTQAAAASDMSTSQAPIDDQQAKSQKKFAELAQRLKSNAAKSSEAPVAVPPPAPPAPTSVAMSQQQPFSSQGDYAGSSYGSDMRSTGSTPSTYNRNTDFQPSNLPDFDLPNSPAGFPDPRSGDPGKEPVQTEAFNKKIEAVKKKIEALKANVPGNAAAAAGGAILGAAMRPEPEQPRVFESAVPRQSMSASSANLGGPPVNRLLEAAQRAVETGSVSRLPAQRSDEDQFEPAMPQAVAGANRQAAARADDALNDSAVREAEASRKEAARTAQEAYSSFRDIGASIKSERTKSTRDVPDRARVRQSFNKQRPPALLIGGLIVAVLAVVAVFTPVKDMIPGAITSVQNLFHAAPASKSETTAESADIDELISSGKLDRARALEDKLTKSSKWTTKDSERHIKMAEKYAESDPPEYDLAIEVLNKIPKKAQFYRKAKTLIRGYQSQKRRSSH